jgi:hypothetical protein
MMDLSRDDADIAEKTTGRTWADAATQSEYRDYDRRAAELARGLFLSPEETFLLETLQP